jgi:hypothetical protein
VKDPVWIEERDALALHDRLLALDGGAAGLRDDGLLQSALARPRQHFAYAESAILSALPRPTPPGSLEITRLSMATSGRVL